MTTVEYSVEVDASPERVWELTSDPRNLPHWDRHIVGIRLPAAGLGPGALYEVRMRFFTIRTTVKAEVLEWEPPWRSRIRLSGLLEATVSTSIAQLPRDRSVLRHEVEYTFRGPLGRFAAASLNAVGGAQSALRRGMLKQRDEIGSRV